MTPASTGNNHPPREPGPSLAPVVLGVSALIKQHLIGQATHIPEMRSPRPRGALLIFPSRQHWHIERSRQAGIGARDDPEIEVFKMCELGPAEEARARAMRAQAREIEAQREAINLQESAAIMFDRAHLTGRSQNGRQRADHAREMLLGALSEREHFEKGF